MPSKTLISKASSYQEIGAFWDEHDATEFGEQTNAEFDVDIQSQTRYYPVDRQLSLKMRKAAKKRGITEETLLNLWIQEKILQTESEL
jgi:hypothetical protein